MYHTHTQTQFITQIFVTRLFTPIFLQVIDSPMNSKLLYKVLESESNVALLGPDLSLDLEEDLLLPNHIPL